MAEKKAPKKSATKKTVDRKALGKESVEKGRKFEDQVADLYRLLGAEVTQNIMIHNKKVDILVTFKVPGSTAKYNLIVECKDEKKRVNDLERVHAFSGLLNLARIDKKAESAEIITRVPWSDQAKGAAKEAGITLLTYQQKISQLMDFEAYLKRLVERFATQDLSRPKEPPLGAYYVDISGKINEGGELRTLPVVNDYVLDWLRRSNNERELAILGGFGSGKSSLCQKLAHDLALSYLEKPDTNRIPILLNLRDFIGKMEIESFITSFLDRECHIINPKFRLFKAMNETGKFFLMFDGLDEMATRVDSDVLEANLLEIEKLAAASNCKTMLTSRPEYFINSSEEQESLNPDVNFLGVRKVRYLPINLIAWEDEQINKFLEQRVPLIEGAKQPWSYYRDKIKGFRTLRDLSQRPVLLEMIVKTLPTLIEENVPISLCNLYEIYLGSELRRQKIFKKRTFELSSKNRLLILQQVACDKYFDVMERIAFDNVENTVREIINPPREQLEFVTRDFLTNTFLIREGDTYDFSHKSILDYLVTRVIHQEVNQDLPDYLERYRLKVLPLVFIRELAFEPENLIKWILSTRESMRHSHSHLGGNAATLLTRLKLDSLGGLDLRGTDLSGALLSLADLRGATLTDARLVNSKLVRAKFNQKDIEGAFLGGCEICFYIKPVEDWTDGHMLLADTNVLLKEISDDFRRPYRAGISQSIIQNKICLDLTINVQLLAEDNVGQLQSEFSDLLSGNPYVFADELEEYFLSHHGVTF